MDGVSDAARQVENYLAHHEDKGLLRLLTCGSVDDGKSTLIGRLLHDCKLIFDDLMGALERDSKTSGTTGPGKLDFALLLDGLQAEREQGITIDIAYRYFATDKRKFIVADAPGHEQYTRNMATAASTAELAILLIDARKGVITQTRRHTAVCAMMGVRKLVLAVNKMDLVGYEQATFDRIVADYRAFAAKLGIEAVTAIPLSALEGQNMIVRSPAMPWYTGPALLPYLEEVDVTTDRELLPMRFPVQWVNRPNLDFRGFSGTLVSGAVSVGDGVSVLPGGQTSRVKRIVTKDGDLPRAVAGQAITLTLADEIDISRGDLLVPTGDQPAQADHFAAHLLWMDAKALMPGRDYLVRMGPLQMRGQITAIKHKIDVNTMEERPAPTLELNDVGSVNLQVDRAVPFDPYDQNRDTGSFILIDRLTNATVGAGMIRFSLWRSTNLVWQHIEVGAAQRAAQKGQKPCVIWLTGLSGSGKSTIANLLDKRLYAEAHHTTMLDGDNVRHGLNRDLGFTEQDRVENIRRVAEVAKLMADAGLITLVSFISPYREERLAARARIGEERFVEVYVKASVADCAARDPKGLYRKAMAGEIRNFTGIDAPYEEPVTPDLLIDTAVLTPEAAVEVLMAWLRAKGYLSAESEGSGI
ncbi:sulfate adenylyltransferase subunit CysN [Rhodospirillum rubrum]|uniref:Multifunctional fusion protein n=1 Tax=Rhodospirillum rubrum (strain ATCC 11170 / ATH 1.1.1 / DSM 467 / LMG 4362 / NCIMB 8255 / S1) TaxID=269796 RepID=Q2RS05_RHORT|nr:sulfate adenylyltransferase subunit CysN [Rhodospirillum rubrum]ABC23090.1 sulfate adenylyltransferase subunit 1 / adenylylsulfate kinase [Rhodospirillum rubrum ATCC 11170]AEO48819.1 bifunctional sulfate adenylyltransferase subunit 1/adenylylsulfate kinase protein [Rhodospirillum rubrum F11]MBK5954718.1 adenylyl-sulfate kinase [Rhodospirillum rubrum]QXG79074.1 sulfate adenylyltransferase subunit CysN [Rhodospirillum rubrum]HAP99107.1 adenylyl-sulfate kinase [Rhodospirillum rubrum]